MEERTAVITGASSGIGRVTAIALAKDGYNLVLGGRNMKALRAVSKECTPYGIDAIAVQTDVTVEADVRQLAERALDRFGAVDVWINNAGVTALGAFDDIPTKVFRRIMDTNYLGSVYGSQAALKQFKAQQYGTLVNIASVFGTIGSPYESPYIASKFAVRGLTSAIRSELHLAGFPDIHVCTVLPATIDTPIYRNAANYMKQEVVPIRPIYPATAVADTILSLLDRPVPEAYVGPAGRALSTAHAILPTDWFERTFARYSARHHFMDNPAPQTDGNLFEPSQATTISGDWPVHGNSQQRRLGIAVAAGIGVGLAAWWLLRRKHGKAT